MSCLKLYWPRTFSLYRPEGIEESDTEECEPSIRLAATDESDWAEETCAPILLQFPRIAGRIGAGRQVDMLTRARTIHANRCCPDCGRAAVVPIDAEPILMSRNRMPVPGSGRLAGFECDACGHAWSVDS
jgi:hypothetical protein